MVGSIADADVLVAVEDWTCPTWTATASASGRDKEVLEGGAIIGVGHVSRRTDYKVI